MRRTTTIRSGTAAALAAVALMATGCGGGDTDRRPSADTISKSLRAKDIGAALGSGGDTLSKKAADCIGKVMTESKMSDQGLRDFLEGGKTFSKADTDAFREVFPTVAACNPVTVPGKG